MDKRLYQQYNLQFFADGPGGEKTEDATTKKLSDARKEGQVAKSQEITIGVSLITMFIILKIFVGKMGTQFLDSYEEYYGLIGTMAKEPVSIKSFQVIINDVIKDILVIALPVLLVSMVSGFLVTLAQVKWEVSTKPLLPKLNKFNPVNGFKRMFGKDKVVELIKAILKMGAIGYMVYAQLKDEWGLIQNLLSLPLLEAIGFIGEVVIDLGLKISIVYLFIGFADLFYQRYKFKKDMRMTKQEVKDEYKQSEGDPHIKGKIKAKMREAAQRRMMQSIAQADVVITNPTHFAVAIRYDKEHASAPIVVAKGADFVAQKIKEKAREHHVEIVENKPLARMLYANVEIGDEIPAELYQMVAEVLAYVYSLKTN